MFVTLRKVGHSISWQPWGGVRILPWVQGRTYGNQATTVRSKFRGSEKGKHILWPLCGHIFSHYLLGEIIPFFGCKFLVVFLFSIRNAKFPAFFLVVADFIPNSKLGIIFETSKYLLKNFNLWWLSGRWYGEISMTDGTVFLYRRWNCCNFYSVRQKMAHVAATFTAEKKINYGERFI